MAAVWARTRAELRQHIGSTLVLTVILGLAAGIMLTAVAGGRRTDSAFSRFVDAAAVSDLSVSPSLDPVSVRALPGVADAGRYNYVFLTFPDNPGVSAVPWASSDRHAWRTIDRGLLVEGRRSWPERADEAVISPGLLRATGARVGEGLRVQLYTAAEAQQAFLGDTPSPTGPVVDVQITGVLRHPDDLFADLESARQEVPFLQNQGSLFLTPAFYDRYIVPIYGESYREEGGLAIRLTDNARDADVRAGLARLNGGRPVDIEQGAGRVGIVQEATRVQATALYAFGGLMGLATLLLLGQALVRQVHLSAPDQAVLAALGMTRAQLAGVGLLRTAVVAMTGAMLAVAVAVAASPAMPVGVARHAEPDPGVEVNVAVFAVGFVAIFASVLAWTAIPAWRAARVARHIETPRSANGYSRLVARLTAWGAPPALMIGSRMALEQGRGLTAAPVRGAVATGIVAVAAILSAATFAASLDHMEDTPPIFGWNWDVAVGNPNALYDTRADVIPRLEANPYVDTFSAMDATTLTVEGRSVFAVGIATDYGAVFPTLHRGRPPDRPLEIALGTATAHALGIDVGGSVEVSFGSRRQLMRVVGTAVLGLSVMTGGSNQGEGVMLTMEALERLRSPPETVVSQYLVRFDPAASRSAAMTSLRRDVGDTVVGPLRSVDVENVGRVRWVPYLLAGMLVALGVATLAHMLVTSVRRRRRDLALLKALGFSRSQVAATVFSQATTQALVALAAGIPLGIASGRWAWSVVAEELGVLVRPVTPGWMVVGAAATTLVLAYLAAVGPGVAAARTPPAVVLRTE